MNGWEMTIRREGIKKLLSSESYNNYDDIKANHVSSSQSDRSKRVNAHFVEHKNAKATRRALKHLDHTLRCTKRYKALGQVNNGLDRGQCTRLRLVHYHASRPLLTWPSCFISLNPLITKLSCWNFNLVNTDQFSRE